MGFDLGVALLLRGTMWTRCGVCVEVVVLLTYGVLLGIDVVSISE